MAGTTIQSQIKVDITAGAKLTGDAKVQFDELRKSLLDTGNTAKDTEKILLQMKEILDADAGAANNLTKATDTLKSGLEGVANTAAVASAATGELKTNLVQVNETIATGFNKAIGVLQNGYSVIRRLALILPGIGISGIFLLLFEGIEKLAEGFIHLESAEKDLDKINKDLTKHIGEQIGQVEILSAKILDHNTTQGDRKKAIDELIKQHPNYYSNLKDESDLTEKLTEDTKKFTEAIIEEARIKAISGKISELAVKIQDEEIDRRKQLDFYNKRIIEDQASSDQFQLFIDKQLEKEEIEKSVAKIERLKKEQQEIIAIGLASANNLEKLGGSTDNKDEKERERKLKELERFRLEYERALKEFEAHIREVNLSPVLDLHKSLDLLQEHYSKLVDIAVKTKQPYTKATEDMEAERLKLIRNYGELVLGEAYKNGQDVIHEKVKTDQQIDKFVEETLNKRLAAQRKAYEEQKRDIESVTKTELDILKTSENSSATLRAQNNLKRLKIIEKGYQDERAAAIRNQQATKNIDNQLTANKAEQAKAQTDISKAKLQSDIEIANETASLLQGLAGILGDTTAAKKDVEIAAVTIQSLAAAVKAQLSADEFFAAGDIPNGIIAEAMAVKAVVQGIASVQKINAVKVPHTNGASGGGGNGSLSGYSAPQIPQAINYTNLSPQSIGQINNGSNQQQQLVRAYVVEGDISGAQARQRGYNNGSTLGRPR